MKSIQAKEEKAKIRNPKIIDIFCRFLSKSENQESHYLLEKMINLNLINSSVTKGIQISKYFVEESKSNNWLDPFWIS